MIVLLSFPVKASIIFYIYHNFLGHIFSIAHSDCFQFSSLASFAAVTGFEDVSPAPYFALFSQRGRPLSGTVRVGLFEAGFAP